MNRRTSLLLCLVLILSMLPLSVGAQNIQERQSSVCSQRTQRLQDVSQALSGKQATLEERMQSVRESVEVRRQEIDEVRTETQNEYNDRYKNWYDDYLKETNDEPSKLAAGIFYQQLLNLTSEWHKARQQARLSYQSQVDLIRQQRFADIRQQVLRFSEESNAAFETLGRTCGQRSRNDVDARNEFVSGLRSARLAYAEKRRSYTSYKDQIQAAAATRDQEDTAARKTFEIGYHAALSVFRETDSSF